jgi:MoaA/NifB/PqqE/SkfB family radical SAM enzyme
LRFLENCRRAGLLKDLHDAGPVFPYVASIGCPCKCVFCTNMIDKWTPLPVGSIEADWRRMRQAGVETVAVMDQFANFDPARFVRILEMAGDLGLKLHFTNGVGLGKIDARSAELLAKTTRLLYVSPESGCALTLRKLRKRFGIETAENALRLLSASGVKVHGHYIVGAPWEGRAAVNESLATVARWSEELGVEAHVQPFVPKRAFRVQGRRVQSVYGRFETFRDGWTEEAVLGLGLRNAAAGASKLIINAGYRCMNDCVFCSVADRPRKDGSFSAQARAMARLEASGVRLLDIDGGEPLLYPGIFELLDLAGCLGYERITLTTNGRALAAGRLLARLKRYGGLDLLISIHGPSAEVHDALTRSPGSFNETVAGMRNAVKAGLSPGMNVTLVRENAAVLPATAALAARLGARVLNIQYYTPFGNVDPALAPGSGSARRVREAVAAAKKAGLPVNLVNFPPCYARDLSPLMMGDFFKESRLMLFADGTLVNLARYLGDRRFKTGKCGACESSIICRGFWRNEGA